MRISCFAETVGRDRCIPPRSKAGSATPPYRWALLALLAATALSAADKSPLADAPSAFIRAQATSPIHWQPWTDAVLAQAKQQPKSVYVFIGSPLSELTRATINQTFTSEKTVAWLNENFFCIFVDADAQPDVAALGQHFITTVKQLKGSPVHLWLTPDTLQPYDGANYLPPSEEWGKPGFLKAARSALDTWQAGPDRAHALAEEAISMMKLPPLDLSTKVDVAAKLEAATKAWVAALDAKNGGFGTAPKLPEPELILFLLGRDKPAQDAAINAARALVAGALRDPVDGGFYRRCIDEEWKEPYYQKTLADQARIAIALFVAAEVAKDDKLRAAGLGALDFALKEMKYPDGSFAAALDGTLEENADPAKRPKFVKVGAASTGSQGLLLIALAGPTDKLLKKEAGQLAARLKGSLWPHGGMPHRLLKQPDELASPSDYLAVVHAFHAVKDDEAGRKLLWTANDYFFDAGTGTYQTSGKNPRTGIALRVPVSGDTPSAEVLALLAGVDAKTADLIRRNLMNQIEYDELPPGDILLGLSQGQK
jgi:uncharacterized protein YyaL (SSP411 family)